MHDTKIQYSNGIQLNVNQFYPSRSKNIFKSFYLCLERNLLFGFPLSLTVIGNTLGDSQ